ncbi:MAG: dihydrodipicolinate synthase family protein [Clostridia bacterium]|nr:dihydrodipicolinate synthase family protein [Clostridia bacterium]
MKKRYDDTILATACIPWDENFHFDKVNFRLEVEHMIAHGINHIYLFGTAGEGYAVNNAQFEEIVSFFAGLMNKEGMYPMVGLIDMSTDRMEEKLKIAYKYGIRDFQFSLPAWHQLNDREILIFMDSLLLKHQDCRFLLYNLGRTKRILEVDELISLAKRYENFVAVKQTRLTEKDIIAFQEETPLQLFLTEQNFITLSKTVDCSFLISVGNLDLEMAKDFFRSVKEKDNDKIQYYQEKYASLITDLKNIMNGLYIDGAYDKLFVKYTLPAFPIRLLPPYEYADQTQFDAFRQSTQKLL